MEPPPYRKKTKMSYFEFTKIEMTKPESLQITKHLDFTWMISFNLLENTPLWIGWNTEWFIAKFPRQRVKYMQQLYNQKGFLKNMVPPLQLLPMI